MMPGVSRGEMNGGYNDFEHGHLRSSSYANGYDPYRKGREEFRDGPRRHNGIDDLDQNSFEMRESRDPTFEVDHLATYTSKSGVTHPEDGLTKLKQMESSTGIWTMRCSLIIERYHIVVIDKGNGDELERFPMANVHEPTAVLKNDRRETYNNLLLFSIIDDPRRKNSPSDMHIFQSINVPAHDLVDEILTAKGETARSRDPPDQRIPPPPRVPAPEPPYYGRSTGAFIGGGGLSATRVGYSYRDDMDTGQNEAMERDVQLLNNCFDDIEKFVSRLQQAAEAYKELERRRDQRGGKKNKKPFSGDGMLSMRARPPPAEDFVDIFQKFKFAFNLLAKLRAHIHTPNAPELVHFLFTPLSLIYEASRDPIHGGRDLSGEAVAPLLLYEAKQLLTNCLTSKEMELWQRLGRAWNLTKEDWSGHVPPYHPRFYNGWAPSPQLVDDIIMPERSSYREEPLRRTQERPGRYVESRREEEPFPRSSRREDYVSSRPEDPYIRREEPPIMSSRREDPYVRREEPPIMSSRREDPYMVREDPYVSRREDPYTRDIRGSARDEIRPPSPAPYRSEEKRNSSNAPKSRAEENIAFAQELRRMGATIYEAGHERKGKNAKELNVEKGDIVQVLDKSRNWWKLKNYRGETGYAPYTILKEYQTGDEYDNSQNSGRRLSGDYSSYINGSNPPPAPPPMGGSARPGTRNEDADSRQRKPAEDKPRPVAPPLKQAPSSHNLRPHGEKSMYSPDLHKEIKTKMNVSDGSSDYSPRGRRRSQDPNWTGFEDHSPRGQLYREPSPRGGRYIEPEPKVSPQRSPRYNDPRDQGYIDPSPRGQPGYPRPRKDINVSQYSAPDEIREWLDMKGFSRRCLELLQGYSGLDLFNLDKKEIERLVGREDGQRLYSLLEVQKVNANYRTRGRSELQAILQRRKEHTNTSDDLELGSRPSFMPDTPDYSPDESDGESEEDFGNAGKTLRNLLERQRKKIQQGGYRGPYQ